MSKRILSLVLALVMVLGTFSFSLAAPSDVEGTDYEKAVERLMLLGIITGYPDGSFKPENNITRAEFAAVALRARGLEYTAQAAKGLPTGFSDVPASHWASGYVGAAAKAGIVNGIGNGKFAPEAPVKYEEAVTMLVRALGYEVDAKAKGGYPHGYLIVANEIGLLDEVRGIPGAPATRGMVAQMTDNALEIPMMIQVGYGDEAKWVVSGTEDTEKVTLLNKLDVDEITGDVIATFRIDSSLDNDEIKIKELNGKTTTFEITENIDADAVLGAGVTAWAKDDVIFAISIGYEEEIRGKNYSFDADQIAYDEISAVSEDEVELYVKDDEFDWEEDAVVYLNNEKVKDLDDQDLVGAYGRFIFNEDDEVVFAYLFDFDQVGVVTSINENEMEFIDVDGGEEDVLALDDAEEIYVFNKDLSAASLDDIEEDTAVFFWIDADDNYYIVINNEKVEGTLEAVRTSDSRVTVDGTNVVPAAAGRDMGLSVYSTDGMDEFEVWDKASYSTLKDYVDENVVVYLDLVGDGLALVTDSDASSTVYGVATWLTDARKPVLTVFTKDGEEVDYTFEDRNDATTLRNQVNFENNDVNAVWFEVNKDGEIKDGEFNFTESTKSATKQDDKQYLVIGGDRYYLEKDTVIIKALNKDGELDPSVIDYEDIINKEITTTNVLFVPKSASNHDLALLVFADKNFDAVDDDQYGILVDHPHAKGGDYVAKINVVGGEEKEYVLASIKGINNKDLAKGDIIKFYFNSKDEVVVTDSIDLSEEKATKSLTVEGKSGKYLELSDGKEYRVTDDTLFYVTTNKGALDTKSSLSKIKVGDTVIILAEDNELKVVLETTPYTDTLVPGEQPGTGEATITYIDEPVKAATDVVVKLVLPENNTEVYKVVAFKADGTPANTVTTLVSRDITASDLGIANPGTEDATYVVRAYKVVNGTDVEISNKVIKNVDLITATLQSATLVPGTSASPAAKAKFEISTDNKIEVNVAGDAGNDYEIRIKEDALLPSNTANVVVNGKVVLITFYGTVPVTDLNDIPEFSALFTATGSGNLVAKEGKTSGGSDAVAATGPKLTLTFNKEMKAASTATLTINSKQVTGSVTWDSAKKVATVTFAADAENVSEVASGNFITGLDLVTKNGVELGTINVGIQ